jgi:tetratricopeptide (TPR) repeat protein
MVLGALREGTLEALLAQRPRLAGRLGARLLQPLWGLAGDAVPRDPLHPLPWRLLLRATMARLRLDGRPGLGRIERSDWLDRPAWRPWLALAGHAGFVEVPAFPDRHRAAPDDSPADRLCGLWDIGASTFYRHLERGRRQLAAALVEGRRLQGEKALARDALLDDELMSHLGHRDPAARRAWHARQAARAIESAAPRAALWHLLQAGDGVGAATTVRRHAVELAGDAEVDLLLARALAMPMALRQRVDGCLARAALQRARGDDAGELAAYDDALRIASAAPAARDRALALGIVYGALGRFHETRDADRSFACMQESADFLQRAGLGDDPAAAEPALRIEYLATLVRLAWLLVLRNDPRCRDLLERADALRPHLPAADPIADEAVAMLEQTWGEVWRRAGDLRRALEHKLRALHLYERLGDRPSILKTWGNLALIYGDAKDFARSMEYSRRVLEMAARHTVEPETIAATHLHMGATAFWQGRYDTAIEHYRTALAIAHDRRLRLLAGRAHYNLAEAHYKRFQAGDDPDDEREGDAHAAAALVAWPDGVDPAAVEATRALKAGILGPRGEEFVDRLLPAERAAHFAETGEVQRHRAALALPQPPAERAASHLAIAQAYLEIAVKEREAALALIAEHRLGPRFDEAVARLRSTFDRALTREERLAAEWERTAADLLDAATRDALLRRLLDAGSIGKSGYADLCGVGLATASKHLGRLAALGLLVQTGKGPSTRYRLP